MQQLLQVLALIAIVSCSSKMCKDAGWWNDINTLLVSQWDQNDSQFAKYETIRTKYDEQSATLIDQNHFVEKGFCKNSFSSTNSEKSCCNFQNHTELINLMVRMSVQSVVPLGSSDTCSKYQKLLKNALQVCQETLEQEQEVESEELESEDASEEVESEDVSAEDESEVESQDSEEIESESEESSINNTSSTSTTTTSANLFAKSSSSASSNQNKSSSSNKWSSSSQSSSSSSYKSSSKSSSSQKEQDSEDSENSNEDESQDDASSFQSSSSTAKISSAKSSSSSSSSAFQSSQTTNQSFKSSSSTASLSNSKSSQPSNSVQSSASSSGFLGKSSSTSSTKQSSKSSSGTIPESVQKLLQLAEKAGKATQSKSKQNLGKAAKNIARQLRGTLCAICGDPDKASTIYDPANNTWFVNEGGLNLFVQEFTTLFNNTRLEGKSCLDFLYFKKGNFEKNKGVCESANQIIKEAEAQLITCSTQDQCQNAANQCFDPLALQCLETLSSNTTDPNAPSGGNTSGNTVNSSPFIDASLNNRRGRRERILQTSDTQFIVQQVGGSSSISDADDENLQIGGELVSLIESQAQIAQQDFNLAGGEVNYDEVMQADNDQKASQMFTAFILIVATLVAIVI